jgi:hypothetical protein
VDWASRDSAIPFGRHHAHPYAVAALAEHRGHRLPDRQHGRDLLKRDPPRLEGERPPQRLDHQETDRRVAFRLLALCLPPRDSVTVDGARRVLLALATPARHWQHAKVRRVGLEDRVCLLAACSARIAASRDVSQALADLGF